MTSPKRDPRITPARPDLAARFLEGMVEASRFSEGQPYVVVSGTTALRSQASGTGAQVSELLFGERFTVYEDRGGWVWGQSARDGYVAMPNAQPLHPIRLQACLPIWSAPFLPI
ncbi:hypothetical protein JCM17843_01020 [Kordiimonadales bacterium JCM 17843]|nr:hypothetical protein JCM17843_01020 [Kordiimonadales bacterium JCM 17843]